MSDMGIDRLCQTDVESLEVHANSLSPCLLSLKPDLLLWSLPGFSSTAIAIRFVMNNQNNK